MHKKIVPIEVKSGTQGAMQSLWLKKTLKKAFALLSKILLITKILTFSHYMPFQT